MKFTTLPSTMIFFSMFGVLYIATAAAIPITAPAVADGTSDM